MKQVGEMNYSNLEDAYGSGFQQRVPVTHQRKDVKDTPIETNGGLAQRAAMNIEKNRQTVDSLAKSLPLDTNKSTENFVASPAPYRPAGAQTFREHVTSPRAVQLQTAREHFTASPGSVFTGDQETLEKLNRVLRLIEQNRTGYETPAMEDMILYIATGLFFLFTFDTFVMLGRTMGRRR
jgi:hypothetical protein